jgi:hypothetical protein
MRINFSAILDVMINHHAESKKAASSPLSATGRLWTFINYFGNMECPKGETKREMATPSPAKTKFSHSTSFIIIYVNLLPN